MIDFLCLTVILQLDMNRVATHFFENFSRFLKIRIFEFNFSSLRLKIVLNSIKTLNRYCKGKPILLNMYLNKNNFEDDKKNLSIG